MKKNKMNRLQKAAGFTLLEIMIVLAIIGGLMGIVAVAVSGKQDRANIDQARIQVTNVAGEVAGFRADTKRYPSSLDELVTRPGDVKRWYGPYVKTEDGLIDPWGNKLQYKYPGEHGNFDVYSTGQDGKTGGQDFDADIGNWE